ncbi:MAG: MGMT family protein [Clostridia bacterium]|nr:MGMT family protein [Clostridia bacterium]
MTELEEKIYKAVQNIPRGKVATYAQIAAMVGNPRMCRAVGNALHKNPFFGIVPCHRVVNSQGFLAKGFVFGGENAQADMLREEGIEVIDGKVDLLKYRM